MQPKKREEMRHEDLFRSRLEQILDHKHPLYVLANQIDWTVFERDFGALYVEQVGRPGLPIRLMVGLHYLKYTYDESDESAVDRFLENPYWQYFCGNEYFEHNLPLDPTSLVRWRQRIGNKGMEKLLKQTLETAKRKKLLKENHMKRVNVDTTVQEKAIAFPTDARLYHKMRDRLVKEAEARGIELRQNYRRLSKKALQRQGNYGHAKQMKRAKRETKKLKIYLGRVIRDIERKGPKPDDTLKELLYLAKRIHDQERHDTNKVYSVHAPEVECISKGKAHKRYEFGCKVTLVTTSKDNWIVGVKALHGNPYDGHTLKGSLQQAKELTGWKPENAYCDRGYRGAAKTIEEGINLHMGIKKKETRSARKWMKRRSAIEPIIGHLKSDNRMERNHLQGQEGDKMNALLSGCGFNIRKLILAFFLPLFQWLFERSKAPQPMVVAV